MHKHAFAGQNTQHIHNNRSKNCEAKTGLKYTDKNAIKNSTGFGSTDGLDGILLCLLIVCPAIRFGTILKKAETLAFILCQVASAKQIVTL